MLEFFVTPSNCCSPHSVLTLLTSITSSFLSQVETMSGWVTSTHWGKRALQPTTHSHSHSISLPPRTPSSCIWPLLLYSYLSLSILLLNHFSLEHSIFILLTTRDALNHVLLHSQNDPLFHILIRLSILSSIHLPKIRDTCVLTDSSTHPVIHRFIH